MPQYKAPVDDMKFLLHDWLNVTELYKRLGQEEAADKDLVNAVIDEAAKFAEQQISPLNHLGDQTGCLFNNGQVSTPEGFKQAYQNYCDAGWASLRFSKKSMISPRLLSMASIMDAYLASVGSIPWSRYFW